MTACAAGYLTGVSIRNWGADGDATSAREAEQRLPRRAGGTRETRRYWKGGNGG
jgi:hypothetical protein